MSYLRPPRVDVSWPASSLTTAFGGYRLYRRPAATPALPWVLIAEVGAAGLAAGISSTNVEAQWRKFTDYEAGWAPAVGGQWAAGWDYKVTVVSSQTGIESQPLSDVSNVVTWDTVPWITSNLLPFLNHPVPRLKSVQVQDVDTLTRYAIAGRDLGTTRQRAELPARSYRLSWDEFGDGVVWDSSSVQPKPFAAEDQVRYRRAAAASGVPVALHRPLGDRVIGPLSAITSLTDRDSMLFLDGQTRLEETSRDLSGVGDYNLPPGLILNGSSQYVTTPDNSLLDPGSAAFTVFCAAAFAGAGSSKYALSKGNGGGAGDGYYLRTNGTANTLQFTVDGATAAVNMQDANAAWFDGNVHVAVGTTSGTAQALYRDGAVIPVATGAGTHGAVANAIALVAGADNGGGSAFMACAPLVAWGLYLRQLSAAEAQALAYYLLGYPGFRAPAGAAIFYDLRDVRCWNGVTTSAKDLTGSTLAGTLTASPVGVGTPWALSLLERF